MGSETGNPSWDSSFIVWSAVYLLYDDIPATGSVFGGENDKIALEAEIACIKFSVYILADSIFCWHEYRRVVASPKVLSWSVISYNNLWIRIQMHSELFNPMIFTHNLENCGTIDNGLGSSCWQLVISGRFHPTEFHPNNLDNTNQEKQRLFHHNK